MISMATSQWALPNPSKNHNSLITTTFFLQDGFTISYKSEFPIRIDKFETLRVDENQ